MKGKNVRIIISSVIAFLVMVTILLFAFFHKNVTTESKDIMDPEILKSLEYKEVNDDDSKADEERKCEI